MFEPARGHTDNSNDDGVRHGVGLTSLIREGSMDALKAPLHLGLGEGLVPRVDRLELRPIVSGALPPPSEVRQRRA
jgi:hypothetical protein